MHPATLESGLPMLTDQHAAANRIASQKSASPTNFKTQPPRRQARRSRSLGARLRSSQASRPQAPPLSRQPAPILPITPTIKNHFRILSFVPSKAHAPHFPSRQNPPHLLSQPFARFRRLISDTKNFGGIRVRALTAVILALFLAACSRPAPAVVSNSVRDAFN